MTCYSAVFWAAMIGLKPARSPNGLRTGKASKLRLAITTTGDTHDLRRFWLACNFLLFSAALFASVAAVIRSAHVPRLIQSIHNRRG